MLFLLSPAKTLDYETPNAVKASGPPRWMARSAELIALLRAKTPRQIAELMDLSDPLAALNAARYAAWSRRCTVHNSRPAVLAFAGDVYDGLDAKSFNEADLAWAQDHLVILSGLYGVLRPLEALQPYRLEMGTRLANARGKDLYAFWGDEIARHLNQRQPAAKARGSEPPVVVNLASQEYVKAVDRRVLKARVIECVFEDEKAGQYKIISFFAKRARGAMARYAVTHRIDRADALRGFDLDGYAWDRAASQGDRWVFRRAEAAAAVLRAA